MGKFSLKFALFVYVLLATTTLSTTFSSVYNQSLLFIIHEFNASSVKIKLTVTVYFWAILFCRYFFGILSDRYGAKNCLMVSIFLAITGAFLCAISKNIDWFIFVRFVQGIGMGGMQIMALVILMQNIFPSQRAEVLAKEQVFFSVSSFVLPLIGNRICHNFSWRFNFILIMLLCLILWVFFLYVPKDLNKTDKNLKAEIPERGRVFKNKQFWKCTFIACLSTSGYILWVQYFSLVIHALEINRQYLLIYQWIPMLPYLLVSLVFGRLTHKISRFAIEKFCFYAQFLALLGIFSLIFISKRYAFFPLLVLLPIVAHNIGGALLRPLMQSKALNSVAEKNIGFASSLVSMTQVSVNAVFALLINIFSHFLMAFATIEIFISLLIIYLKIKEKN